jgi:hypothetical protein
MPRVAARCMGQVLDSQPTFSARECERIESLVRLLPPGRRALDVGARDGHISARLVDHFSEVLALDLIKPELSHPKLRAVQGDAACLAFPECSFDAVLCAELLEHLQPPTLEKVCRELTRVTRFHLLIGVPYKQDTRLGRTTCISCGQSNPPWGHVNSFDEHMLLKLFPELTCTKIEFVGTSDGRTNWLSSRLMDYAGNPYGTYAQQEVCVHCGSRLHGPPARNLTQKICTAAATRLQSLQRRFARPSPNWMHVLFAKTSAVSLPRASTAAGSSQPV